LTRLLGRLEALLTQRLGRVVLPPEPVLLDLLVGEQATRLTVTADRVRVEVNGAPGAHPVRLEPEAFFLLLFGAASSSELAITPGMDAHIRAVLTALFPRGAPIYWRTDIV
jgi:hypothetical protein